MLVLALVLVPALLPALRASRFLMAEPLRGLAAGEALTGGGKTPSPDAPLVLLLLLVPLPLPLAGLASCMGLTSAKELSRKLSYPL